MRAKDTQGSIGAVATISFTIDAVAPFSDSAAPVVGAVNPTSLNTNVMTAFSVSYSDNVGVASCSIYSDGVNQGTMTLSGGTGSTSGTASRNLTYQNAGISNLQVRCTDAAGNTGFGSSTAVTVSVGSGDTTAPSQPSSLTRTTPSSDNTPSFSWGVSSDNVAVTSYEVQLDGGSFMNIGNVLGYTATVLVQGSHTIAVRARDNAGNVSSAASLSFTISANASDEAATPTLPPPPSSSPGGPPFSLDRMRTDSDIVIRGNLATLRTDLGVMECDFTENAGIANAIRVFGNTANESTRAQIAVFNACGTKSTRHLGSGERLGVVNSYRAAFGRLPSTAEHWFDVIKIANDRFPGETSASAEASARLRFRTVYGRDPNMSHDYDRNAVYIMAYGLRPLPRNLNSEAVAIATFRAAFGTAPVSAIQWDTVRAVAYSGATR